MKENNKLPQKTVSRAEMLNNETHLDIPEESHALKLPRINVFSYISVKAPKNSSIIELSTLECCTQLANTKSKPVYSVYKTIRLNKHPFSKSPTIEYYSTEDSSLSKSEKFSIELPFKNQSLVEITTLLRNLEHCQSQRMYFELKSYYRALMKIWKK